MAIDRTNYNALIQDDGTNTLGSVFDKVDIKDVILDPADAAFTDRPATSAPTTTGTQTALAIPAGTGTLVQYLNNATLLTVQGIDAGIQGQWLILVSKGAGQVDFAHLHASGTALGKLKLFATSGLTSLAAGVGVAVFEYDATVTQWRLVSHEQGAPLPWTPVIGGVTSETGQAYSTQVGYYVLRGRTVTAWCRAVLSTLGTLTGTAQIKGLPFTVANVTASAFGTASVFWSGTTTSFVGVQANLVVNTSTANLSGITAAATAFTLLVQGDLANTTDLRATLIYPTS